MSSHDQVCGLNTQSTLCFRFCKQVCPKHHDWSISNDFVIIIIDCLISLSAAFTTTRSTTRRSGDQMGDQITPGNQIDDQIPIATKMWKLGRPSGRLEQSGRPSGHQMKLASVRIYLRGPWYLPKRRNSNQIWSPRSDLVTQKRSGCLSGHRGIWSSIWSW